MDQDRRERIMALNASVHPSNPIKPGRRTFDAGCSVKIHTTESFYLGVNSISIPRSVAIPMRQSLVDKLKLVSGLEYYYLPRAKFIFVKETDYVFISKQRDSWETVSLIYSVYDFKIYAVPANCLRKSTTQRKIK
jgi:hypothetical protein